MRQYAARRLLFFVPVLLAVSVLTFTAARLIPGEEAFLVLGLDASKEDVRIFRESKGLNDPLPQQYIRWLGGVLRGDPGESLEGGRNIGRELRARFPVTATIVLLSFTFTVTFGVTFGLLAAVFQNRPVDYAVRTVSIFGLSIPDFFMLTLLMIVPAILWRYAPPFGYIPFWEDPWRAVRQFVPPTLLLALGHSALLMRLTRSAMLEVLRTDYVRTAHAKGLESRAVFIRHALKNALIPIITVSGILISGLLGGSIILENVTSLPGLGQYTFAAVTRRDYNVIMTMSMYAAVVVMTANLVVDLLYAAVDPRIRYR
jgi:peptide/nickel transport system permease protein